MNRNHCFTRLAGVVAPGDQRVFFLGAQEIDVVYRNEANGLSLLLARLPHAKTVEDFDAMLPWNVKAELAAAIPH